MSALFLVLAIPLGGGAVLALVGHRDRAMELNVAFSTGTFLAACTLTVQVVADGPLPMALQSAQFEVEWAPRMGLYRGS